MPLRAASLATAGIWKDTISPWSAHRTLQTGSLLRPGSRAIILPLPAPMALAQPPRRQNQQGLLMPRLTSLLPALLLAIAGLALCSAPLAAADQPNILWITCEDISPHLGCYGDDYAVTPNIDRLAAEGVLYTQAFAPIGVCAPARSCLITGMYPPSIGSQHMPGTIRPTKRATAIASRASRSSRSSTSPVATRARSGWAKRSTRSAWPTSSRARFTIRRRLWCRRITPIRRSRARTGLAMRT